MSYSYTNYNTVHSDLKTAIIAELLKMNKKPTGNERVLSTTVDKGVGETLG